MPGILNLIGAKLEAHDVLSLRGGLLVALALVGLSAIHTIASAIYSIYFHPLSHVPGPKLWIAFKVFKVLGMTQGRADLEVQRLHEQYGEVVRIGRDELSFITPEAWKDIYGHGHSELPKWYPPGIGMDKRKIIAANHRDHFRFRRAMLPAFSDKALGQQEPLIAVYIDLLVQRLREVAVSKNGGPTDMVHWYSLTTFDMIADLAYGKSLEGLAEGKSNAWLESIDKVMRLMPILVLIGVFPLLGRTFHLLAGTAVQRAQDEHFARVEAMCEDRIRGRKQADRGDFMDYMMRSRGQAHEMRDDELIANSDLIMVAGSETTATLLSGATYWLLRTPHALARATREVRETFASDQDISFRAASAKLPYLLACLDEGLRLFPPVPLGLQRAVPDGAPPADICGLKVPAGTRVAVHQLSAFQSELNFARPKEFIPERWLPEAVSDPASPFFADRRDVHRPFSFGPRDCIGRNLAYHEMRLIMAKVLWNFDLSLAAPEEDWHQQKIFGLWEKPPLRVVVKVRKGE